MSFEEKLLVNSLDSGISLDNDNKMLSEIISEYKLIIRNLDIDKKYHDEQRKRLSKISDRKSKKNNIENCNVCFAVLNTDDRKSCVPCCICSKIICRGEKCSIWLPKAASWECQLCSLSSSAVSRTNEWIDRQLITNKSYHPISKSEIFLPFTENDRRTSLKSLSISNFDTASQPPSISSYGMEKERIREHVEDILAEMLGGSLDNISVGQISKSQKYLPLYENKNNYDNNNETTNNVSESSHVKLKRLIEKIIEETLRLPSIIDYSGIPSKDSRKRYDDDENSKYFDPKKYQELLATAVLNKIVDSYNYERRFKNNSETNETNATNLDKNHNSIETNNKRRGSSSGDSFEPRSDSSLTDPIRDVSKCDNISPSDSCSNIYTASLNDDKESMLSDYLAGHKIPLPDLSTDSESAIEDFLSCPSNGNDKTWEDNWLFKKKKLNSSSSVGMLVPAPKEDIKTLIGDRTADEMSDLSDIEEDHIQCDINENGRIQNKSVIGGKSSVGIFDELLEQTSLISSSSLYENEPIYTEARNDYVLGNDGLHEAGNRQFYKFESDPIPIKNEAINSAITVEILKNSPPKKLPHPRIHNMDFDEPILPPPMDFNDNQIIYDTYIDDTISGSTEQIKLMSPDNSLPVISNTYPATTSFNNTKQQNQEKENTIQSNEVKSLRHSAVHFLAAVALGPVLTMCTPEVEEQIIKGINDRDLLNFKLDENKKIIKSKSIEEATEVKEEGKIINKEIQARDTNEETNVDSSNIKTEISQITEVESMSQKENTELDSIIEKPDASNISTTDTKPQEKTEITAADTTVNIEIQSIIVTAEENKIQEETQSDKTTANVEEQKEVCEKNQDNNVDTSNINTENSQITEDASIPQKDIVELDSITDQPDSNNISTADTKTQEKPEINETDTTVNIGIQSIIVTAEENKIQEETQSDKTTANVEEQTKVCNKNEEDNVDTSNINTENNQIPEAASIPQKEIVERDSITEQPDSNIISNADTKTQEKPEISEADINVNIESQSIIVHAAENKIQEEIQSDKTTANVEEQTKVCNKNEEDNVDTSNINTENNQIPEAASIPQKEIVERDSITEQPDSNIISNADTKTQEKPEITEADTNVNIESQSIIVHAAENKIQEEIQSDKATANVEEQTKLCNKNEEDNVDSSYIKTENSEITEVESMPQRESAELDSIIEQPDSNNISTADTKAQEKPEISEADINVNIESQSIIVHAAENKIQEEIQSDKTTANVEEQTKVCNKNEEDNVDSCNINTENSEITEVESMPQKESAELDSIIEQANSNNISTADTKAQEKPEITETDTTVNIESQSVIVTAEDNKIQEETQSDKTTANVEEKIEVCNKNEENNVDTSNINTENNQITEAASIPQKEIVERDSITEQPDSNIIYNADTKPTEKPEITETDTTVNIESQSVIVTAEDNKIQEEIQSDKTTANVEEKIEVCNKNEENNVDTSNVNTENSQITEAASIPQKEIGELDSITEQPDSNIISNADTKAPEKPETTEADKVNIESQSIIVTAEENKIQEEIQSDKETVNVEEQRKVCNKNEEDNVDSSNIKTENSEITEVESMPQRESAELDSIIEQPDSNNISTADTKAQEKPEISEADTNVNIESQSIIVHAEENKIQEETQLDKETANVEEQTKVCNKNEEDNVVSSNIKTENSEITEVESMPQRESAELDSIIEQPDSNNISTGDTKAQEKPEISEADTNVNIESPSIIVHAEENKIQEEIQLDKETVNVEEQTKVCNKNEGVNVDSSNIKTENSEITEVESMPQRESAELDSIIEQADSNNISAADTKAQEKPETTVADKVNMESQSIIVTAEENKIQEEIQSDKETVNVEEQTKVCNKNEEDNVDSSNINTENSEITEVESMPQRESAELDSIIEQADSNNISTGDTNAEEKPETIEPDKVNIESQSIIVHAEENKIQEEIQLDKETVNVEEQTEVCNKNEEVNVDSSNIKTENSEITEVESMPQRESAELDSIIEQADSNNISAADTKAQEKPETTVADKVNIESQSIIVTAEENKIQEEIQSDKETVNVEEQTKVCNKNEEDNVDSSNIKTENSEITEIESMPQRESAELDSIIEQADSNNISTGDTNAEEKPETIEPDKVNIESQSIIVHAEENKIQEEIQLDKETVNVEEQTEVCNKNEEDNVDSSNIKTENSEITEIESMPQRESAELDSIIEQVDSNNISTGDTKAQEKPETTVADKVNIESQSIIVTAEENKIQEEIQSDKETVNVEEQTKVCNKNEEDNVDSSNINTENSEITEVESMPQRESAELDSIIEQADSNNISTGDTNAEEKPETIEPDKVNIESQSIIVHAEENKIQEEIQLDKETVNVEEQTEVCNKNEEVNVDSSNIKTENSEITEVESMPQRESAELDSIIEQADSNNISAADTKAQEKPETTVADKVNIESQSILVTAEENKIQEEIQSDKETVNVEEQTKVCNKNEEDNVDSSNINTENSEITEVESMPQRESAELDSIIEQADSNNISTGDTNAEEKPETIEPDKVNIESQSIIVHAEENKIQEEIQLDKETVNVEEQTEVCNKNEEVNVYSSNIKTENSEITEVESMPQRESAELDSIIEQADSNNISTGDTNAEEKPETIEPDKVNIESQSIIVTAEENKIQEEIQSDKETVNVEEQTKVCNKNEEVNVDSSNINTENSEITEVESMPQRESAELDSIIEQADSNNISTADTNAEEKPETIEPDKVNIESQSIIVTVEENKIQEEIQSDKETVNVEEQTKVCNKNEEDNVDSSNIKTENSEITEFESMPQMESAELDSIIEQVDSNNISTGDTKAQEKPEISEADTNVNIESPSIIVHAEENKIQEEIQLDKETVNVEEQTEVCNKNEEDNVDSSNINTENSEITEVESMPQRESAELDSIIEQADSNNISTADTNAQEKPETTVADKVNIESQSIIVTAEENKIQEEIQSDKETVNVEEQTKVCNKNEEDNVDSSNIKTENSEITEIESMPQRESAELDSIIEQVDSNNISTGDTKAQEKPEITEADTNVNIESQSIIVHAEENKIQEEIQSDKETVNVEEQIEVCNKNEEDNIDSSNIKTENSEITEIESMPQMESAELDSIIEQVDSNNISTGDTKAQEKPEITEADTNVNIESQSIIVHAEENKIQEEIQSDKETVNVEEQIEVCNKNEEDNIDSSNIKTENSEITEIESMPQRESAELDSIIEQVDSNNISTGDTKAQEKPEISEADTNVNIESPSIIVHAEENKIQEEIQLDKETVNVEEQTKVCNKNEEVNVDSSNIKTENSEITEVESMPQRESAELDSIIEQADSNNISTVDKPQEKPEITETDTNVNIESQSIIIHAEENKIQEEIQSDKETVNVEEQIEVCNKNEEDNIDSSNIKTENSEITEIESMPQRESAELDSIIEQVDSNNISTDDTKAQEKPEISEADTNVNIESQSIIIHAVENKIQEEIQSDKETVNVEEQTEVCNKNEEVNVDSSNINTENSEITEVESMPQRESAELDSIIEQVDSNNISTDDTKAQEKPEISEADTNVNIESPSIIVHAEENKIQEEIQLDKETVNVEEQTKVCNKNEEGNVDSSNIKTENSQITEVESMPQRESAELDSIIQQADSNNISTGDTKPQEKQEITLQNFNVESHSVIEQKDSSIISTVDIKAQENKVVEIVGGKIHVIDANVKGDTPMVEGKSTQQNITAQLDSLKEENVSSILSTAGTVLQEKKAFGVSKTETIGSQEALVSSLPQNSNRNNLTKIISNTSELEKRIIRDEIDGCTSDCSDRTSSDSNATDESTHTVLDVDEDIATTIIKDDNTNLNLPSGHSNILNNSNTKQANITNTNDNNFLINNITNNQQNKLDSLKKSEFSKTLESDDDNSEASLHLVPGSIAEREHKKWYNAVEMPNNPYAPEALRRRLSNGKQATFDIPNINPTNEETLSSLEDPNVSLEADKTDFTRYSRDYYINENVQTTSPRKCVSALNSVNMDDEDVNIENVIKGNHVEALSSTEYALGTEDNLKSINLTDNSDIYSAKLIFIGESENTDKYSIDNINPSRNSIDNNNINNNNSDSLTPSEDSDTLRIYNLNKQETKLITKENNNNNNNNNNSNNKDDNELISNETTTVPIPKPRPNNLQFEPASLQSASTARIVTPTSFKFLQPKRKLIEPSQIMSFDSNTTYIPGTPEKQVIEDDVIKNLPSVKALAQAFLLTTKTIQHAKRPKSLPADFQCSQYESLPTENISQEVEVTTTPPSTPVLEVAESDAIDRPVSPVLTPGKLKDNIAFFENLKKK